MNMNIERLRGSKVNPVVSRIFLFGSLRRENIKDPVGTRENTMQGEPVNQNIVT